MQAKEDPAPDLEGGRGIPLRCHVKRRRTSRTKHSLTSIETQFLDSCHGADTAGNAQASQAHLVHFRHVTQDRWSQEFDSLLHPSIPKADESFSRAMRICQAVAECYRSHPGVSISRVIKHLQRQDILREEDTLNADPVAQQLIFNALGWISFLYVPARAQSTKSFRIYVACTTSAIKPSVDMEKASRPLDELLRSIGDALPKQSVAIPTSRSISQQEAEPKLLVSYLNIATMRALANMQIVWVDAISGHLEFDPTIPSLSIFRCPSYCKMQRSRESILSILLQDYYEEDEKPSKDFSATTLVDEITLSYGLLFKHDRNSRRLYQTSERHRAGVPTASGLAIDPWLDELCWKSYSSDATSAVRDSFDPIADFPIYKDRLQRIQRYMEGIQPNRFMSLWRDRRDLKLWYTIWVVIILQLIALILTLFSTVLTAVQVAYAQKAYQVQLRQEFMRR